MNPPADWYPDPTGRHEQRYWDGGQWTEHVFTDGVQGVDPLEAAAPAESDTTATEDEGQAEQVEEVAEVTESAEPTSEASAAFGEASAAYEENPAFAAAYSEQTAPARRDDEDADLWTPAGETAVADEPTADEPAAPIAAEEAVDTAVEAQDVVATLDEVEAAPAEPVTTGGLDDAFVLSPETASRIVGQRSDDGPQSAPEPEAADGDADAPTQDAPTAAPEPEATAPPAALADAPPPSMGAIDAPPPTVAPVATAASSGGLGITGDLVSGAFSEREDDGAVALQNVRLLRCHVEAGSGVIARQGTMVAYQGEVLFERQGAGGVGRALKRAATGEGMAMMRVEGSGDVFFADDAQHVFLLELDGSGPGISVNGRNVLAFSASLDWDIERVKGASLLAGGLFNTTLTGRGWVALVADGEPVVLRTDEAPTYVDVNALVAWSGGLATRVVNQVSAKSLVGLGSGEAFQMAFDGTGIVIVQPSEGPMQGAAAT